VRPASGRCVGGTQNHEAGSHVARYQHPKVKGTASREAAAVAAHQSKMTNENAKKKREAKCDSSSDSEDEERFKDFTQVVIPVEEERVRTTGLPVRWSAVDKEDAVKLSDENLTASCHCGGGECGCVCVWVWV